MKSLLAIVAVVAAAAACGPAQPVPPSQMSDDEMTQAFETAGRAHACNLGVGRPEFKAAACDGDWSVDRLRRGETESEIIFAFGCDAATGYVRVQMAEDGAMMIINSGPRCEPRAEWAEWISGANE